MEEKSASTKECGINQCESAALVEIAELVSANRLSCQKKKENLDFLHKFLESKINLIYAFL